MIALPVVVATGLLRFGSCIRFCQFGERASATRTLRPCERLTGATKAPEKASREAATRPALLTPLATGDQGKKNL